MTTKLLSNEEKKALLEKYSNAVNNRLPAKRAQHVHSVSDFAGRLANFYGFDNYEPKVAGLLHDWDKIYKGQHLVKRMIRFGLSVPKNVELLYPVLHCFTGANAVKQQFPEVSKEVIHAIYHHTLGGVEMNPLDMIVYVADSIEPMRSDENRPALKNLRDMVGKEPLHRLYMAVYDETLHSLIDRKRFIHPMTLEIYNGIAAKFQLEKGI